MEPIGTVTPFSWRVMEHGQNCVLSVVTGGLRLQCPDGTRVLMGVLMFFLTNNES